MKDKEKSPKSKTQHWEIQYNTNKPSENMEATEGSDFAPKRSNERKTVYVKVNKEDH